MMSDARITISIPDVVGDSADLIRSILERESPSDNLTVVTYPDEPASTAEWVRRIQYADGVILGWKLPDEALAAAERLAAISFLGTGAADQLSLPLCEERGIAVHTVSGYGDNAVAEHTIALLFAAWHQIPTLNSGVHAGQWVESSRRELRGSTLGIIGYGGIAQRVAAMADALGMYVRIWSRSLTPGAELPHGTASTLEDVLSLAHAVSVHLALTAETVGFIDESLLSQLRPGAIFLNTARAGVVDTDALVGALRDGRISQAGIDVFSEEPVAADNPLLGLPNAVLTPHIAYNTANAVRALNEMATRNLIRHFWPSAPRS